LLLDLRFDGEPVVVTGAGTGIGRAACAIFAELGASVVLVGRSLAPLEETAELLKPAGVETLCLPADVASEDDVARVRDAVTERWGMCRALVNNAGNNFRTPLAELTTAKWRELMGVNLDGTFFMTRAFLPLLEAAGGRGAIVNVASIFGLMGPAEMPVYAAAKGGVISLTRQLAVDYGPKGVRVNSVCPGPVLTERVKGYYADGTRDISLVAKAVVLGRMGEPHEIGNTIAFLASSAASFVHGATIVVDGGRTIR
jgi:meso-butanediol dehydrogenase / (S,S)-butanediol dehydrogenase / diacetyl reductase